MPSYSGGRVTWGLRPPPPAGTIQRASKWGTGGLPTPGHGRARFLETGTGSHTSVALEVTGIPSNYTIFFRLSPRLARVLVTKASAPSPGDQGQRGEEEVLGLPGWFAQELTEAAVGELTVRPIRGWRGEIPELCTRPRASGP